MNNSRVRCILSHYGCRAFSLLQQYLAQGHREKGGRQVQTETTADPYAVQHVVSEFSVNHGSFSRLQKHIERCTAVFSSPNLECQIYCSDAVAFRLYLIIIVQPLTN
jgi:hypothetical protein